MINFVVEKSGGYYVNYRYVKAILMKRRHIIMLEVWRKGKKPILCLQLIIINYVEKTQQNI